MNERARFEVTNRLEATHSLLQAHGLNGVVDQWRALRGNQRLPLWSSFDFFDFSPDLISGFSVVDVIDGGRAFDVRFWGTAHVSAFGHELTGKRLPEDEHFGLFDSFLLAAPEVIRTGEPSIACNTVTMLSGLELEFPVVRLPFSDHGNTVDHILTAENVVEVLDLSI